MRNPSMVACKAIASTTGLDLFEAAEELQRVLRVFQTDTEYLFSAEGVEFAVVAALYNHGFIRECKNRKYQTEGIPTGLELTGSGKILPSICATKSQ